MVRQPPYGQMIRHEASARVLMAASAGRRADVFASRQPAATSRSFRTLPLMLSARCEASSRCQLQMSPAAEG